MKYGAAYEKKFLKESGMMFFGKAQFNYMKKIMDTKPMGDALALVRDHVSTLAMSKTQFLYEKFEHPAMFRNGMGRLFGQFITWPVNYISLIADTFGSDTLSIGQKAKFLASTAAIGVGVATGLQAAGIKGDSFLPWNSVLFQGGPYYQMMNDLLGSISGGPDGSSHWRNFSRALVGLVPFSGEGTGVMRAIDAFKRGEAWEGFLHLTSAPIVLANHPKEAPNDLEKSLQDAGKLMFEGKTALDKMGTSGLGLLK
jgi:hypothetical protein